MGCWQILFPGFMPSPEPINNELNILGKNYCIIFLSKVFTLVRSHYCFKFKHRLLCSMSIAINLWRQYGTVCTHITSFYVYKDISGWSSVSVIFQVFFFFRNIFDCVDRFRKDGLKKDSCWECCRKFSLLVALEVQEVVLMGKEWVLAGGSQKPLLSAHRMLSAASASPQKGRSQLLLIDHHLLKSPSAGNGCYCSEITYLFIHLLVSSSS